jgi:hypothetical protein
VAKRPVLYQAVAPNAVHPEMHRERIRWLESCAERGLRVYGQGVTRRGGIGMTFVDWNWDAPRKSGSHTDSALEGTGFEPSVPRKAPGGVVVSVPVRAEFTVGGESSRA